MTTLSLSCSRKLYELLAGAYQTERFWVVKFRDPFNPTDLATSKDVIPADSYSIPAPSFSETIRLLPKIAEKKGWIHWVQESDEPEKLAEVMEFTCWLYMKANTEEEGMAEVSKYLEKIL